MEFSVTCRITSLPTSDSLVTVCDDVVTLHLLFARFSGSRWRFNLLEVMDGGTVDSRSNDMVRHPENHHLRIQFVQEINNPSPWKMHIVTSRILVISKIVVSRIRCTSIALISRAKDLIRGDECSSATLQACLLHVHSTPFITW